MDKSKLWALLILIGAALLTYFVVTTEQNPNSSYRTKYGLDLSGGTHLLYEADTTNLPAESIADSMQSLKEVIERRINIFGVSEPVIQTEHTSIGDGAERLIVELPGVTDIQKAVETIGKTPLLEFKLVNDSKVAEYTAALNDYSNLQFSLSTSTATSTVVGAVANPTSLTLSTSSSLSLASTTAPTPALTPAQKRAQQIRDTQNKIKLALAEAKVKALEKQAFVDTGLTGALLKKSQLAFSSGQGGQQPNAFTSTPYISIEFNGEGASLFEKITGENVGKQLAIFLDGSVLSSPTINEKISGGTAQITGQFSTVEAKSLVRDLNMGALPVPIKLVSTQSIGASLGESARNAGMNAGIIGLTLVALFLILWYRLPGFIATVALSIYLLIMISLFKFIPVVLTSAGIAGFILSIGMAVDANILVFERMKEEFRKGDKSLPDAVKQGFGRAWSSIRDGNSTTIISGIVLYLAGTSLTKGFAVTLILGTLVSMFSSMIISRTLMFAITPAKPSKIMKFLYGSGLSK